MKCQPYSRITRVRQRRAGGRRGYGRSRSTSRRGYFGIARLHETAGCGFFYGIAIAGNGAASLAARSGLRQQSFPLDGGLWPPDTSLFNDAGGHSGTCRRGVPSSTSRTPRHGTSRIVLFVADLLHPVDRLAVELLLNRDVRHRRCRRRPMPVLFASREPDDVAGTNLLDGTAPSLRASTTRRHDERLTERMRVPGRSRAWLERHPRAGAAHRGRRLEQRIDPDRPCKPVAGSFAGWLRTDSFNFHRSVPHHTHWPGL